jgi:MFS family permease
MPRDSQISYDSVGASAPYLRKAFGFGAEEIGDLYSAYHLPNTVMVALGGILIDRIGAVNAAILFTAVAALGTAIVASARTMGLMMLGRVVVGLGGESLCAAQLTLLAQCFGTAQVDDDAMQPASEDVMRRVRSAASLEGRGSGAGDGAGSAALSGLSAPPPMGGVDAETDTAAGAAGAGAGAGRDILEVVHGGEDAIARMDTSSLPALPHAAGLPAAEVLAWQLTFPTTAVAFALQLMLARVGTLCVFLLLPTIFREAGYAAEWVVVAFTLLSFANALLFALLYRTRGWDKPSIAVHRPASHRVLRDGVYGAGAGGAGSSAERLEEAGGGRGDDFSAPLREVGPTADSEHPRSAHVHLAAPSGGASGAAAAAGDEEPMGELEGREDEETEPLKGGSTGGAGALLSRPSADGLAAMSPPPAVRARRRVADGPTSGLDALPSEHIADDTEGSQADLLEEGRLTGGRRAGGSGGDGATDARDMTCLQLLWKGLFVDTAYAVAHFKGKLALLGLFLVIYSSISVSLVDFATDMFNERWGYSDVRASQTTSIMTAVAIVSTVPIAYLLDVIQRPGLMLFVGAMLVLPGHALLLVARTIPPEFACVLIGLGGSVVSATLWPALSGVIQPSQLGTMMGFLLALQNWALCFAPMTVGVVRDRTGGYELVLGTFIALDLVCGLLAIAVAVLEGDDATNTPPAPEKSLSPPHARAESFASLDATPAEQPAHATSFAMGSDHASEGQFAGDGLDRSASVDWDGMDSLPPA